MSSEVMSDEGGTHHSSLITPVIVARRCWSSTTPCAKPTSRTAASPPSATSMACTAAIAPDRMPKQILTIAQKEELLREMDVEALLIVPFTHEFSRWTADRFIEEFLVAALKVAEVRIGRDFCFGAGREGNLARLEAAGERFGFD